MAQDEVADCRKPGVIDMKAWRLEKLGGRFAVEDVLVPEPGLRRAQGIRGTAGTLLGFRVSLIACPRPSQDYDAAGHSGLSSMQSEAEARICSTVLKALRVGGDDRLEGGFSCNEACPSDRASTIGSAFAPNDQASTAASVHR
jgi:hypothetical protein